LKRFIGTLIGEKRAMEINFTPIGHFSLISVWYQSVVARGEASSFS